MDNGFIVLWRQITETSFYRDSAALHLSIHCIIKANHKSKKIIFNNQEHVIDRGQFITGRAALSRELGLKESTVRNKILLLKKVGFLDIKSNSRFSVVTVRNYNSYQNQKSALGQNFGQPEDSQRTARGHNQQCNNETMKQREPIMSSRDPKKSEIKNEKYQKYVDAWNTLADKHSKLSRIEALTKTRVSKIRIRSKEPLFKFDNIIDAVNKQPFLYEGRPGEDNPWVVNFDWIISNDTNYIKIIEMRYKLREASGYDTDDPRQYL